MLEMHVFSVLGSLKTPGSLALKIVETTSQRRLPLVISV
jgi:hypothetical protein